MLTLQGCQGLQAKRLRCKGTSPTAASMYVGRPRGHLCQDLVSTVTRLAHGDTCSLKKTPVTCNHNFHELPLIQFAFGHSWSSAHAYFLLSWLERFETWEMFLCRIRLTTLVIETVLFLHAVRIIFVISWWLAKMYFPIWNLRKVHGYVYSLKEGVAFKWTILVIEIGIDSASAAV